IVTLLGAAPGGCADARERILAQIEAQARPGDVVLLASLRMPELRGHDWRRGHAVVMDDILHARSADDDRTARQDAEAVLARLEALQVKIVIDAPLPIFKASAYRCSDPFNRMNPACADGLTMPRADLERLRAPQMALLASLALTHPALHVWDPLPLLCKGNPCSAMDGQDPLFFDSDHLSGHGNRVLLPDFVATLQQIAVTSTPSDRTR
ncbi:MAG: SGNH hydrolase domain-containing protein, partial [Stenotrophomonas sp.]